MSCKLQMPVCEPRVLGAEDGGPEQDDSLMWKSTTRHSGDESSQPRPHVRDPGDFGKVAVLMGGRSAEREISLQSGGRILRSLVRHGVDAHGVDVGDDILQRLAQGGYERAFIALHGKGGEDGVIQGVLETLRIPYTGSGVLGSALAMDKLRTKQVWRGTGLPTPHYAVLDEHPDFSALPGELGLPLMVKPAREGSSFGMSLVRSANELPASWEAARRFDREVFVESWIGGVEYSAAILGAEVLPLIGIETPREFYDFDAKYCAADTRYLCPCGLERSKEKELQALALQAFEALGCGGWGRVDMIRDQAGSPWLIEVNTVPGMTDHSLVPMAARQAGIGFDELVWRIMEQSVRAQVRVDGG